ncbi:hypothetical protein WSK_1073 [Novosphingobium sp. Rr 2-17]|nr:hypothetical protein WSK_1073 [Novosphingobium sp. Rr 2-17]
MREDLARGDAMSGTVQPVLRHLVAAEDMSIFNDEILARLRAMLRNLAEELSAATEPASVDHLVRALLDEPVVLSHAHALALEWQLAERLQVQCAVDPIVSPLVQDLIAVSEAKTQPLAMEFLAAQSRWCHAQRRMLMPLAELPAPVRAAAIDALGQVTGKAWPNENVGPSHADAPGRVDVAGRLISSLPVGQALDVTQAGVALFITALARGPGMLGSGQGRDGAMRSTTATQIVRLALGLLAAGVEPAGVERQLMVLHPAITPPSWIARLDAVSAAALVAHSDLLHDQPR